MVLGSEGLVHRLLHTVTAIVVILVCGISGASCSAARAPLTPPEKGGPPWVKLASDHFVVETDVDRSTALAILHRLDEGHAALAHVLRRPPRAHDTPVEVVVFERALDFRNIAGQKLNAAAFFSAERPGDFEQRPMIVMHDSDLVDETRMTAQHELTHRFLHERFASLPPWLDEGLALYYESARVDEDRIVLGAPAQIDFSARPYFWTSPRDTYEQEEVPLHLAPTLRQLTEATREEFYAARAKGQPERKESERSAALYAGAWRLVHLLMNGPNAAYRARFMAFLDAVEHGANAREAFLEQLGLDWNGLDQAYRAYLSVERPQLAIVAYRSAPPAAPPVAETMRARDVHLLWARVMPWTKDGLARVEEQLDAARAEDPRSTDVLRHRAAFLMFRGDLETAKADLDAALAEAPADPRTLHALLLWHRARAAASREAVRDEPPADIVGQLAQHAVTAPQLSEVAGYYGTHGRVDDAMRFSQRALAADPLCRTCQVRHAVLLFLGGHLAEAMAATDRALAITPERATAVDLVELRRKIQKAAATAGKPLR